MEILEAFDLTGSFRDAGELAGCSHHTVAAYVAKRDEGRLGGEGPVRRERIIDSWLPRIEEWVERSRGKIRADRCHAKLKALGFEGSDRTVRRAVAEAKKNFGAVGARNLVVAGQAALRYSLMRPFERPLHTAIRTDCSRPGLTSTFAGGC